MKITVDNRIVGYGILALSILWPFAIYPFQSESFFTSSDSLSSIAQVWREITCLVVSVTAGVGVIAVVVLMISGNIEFSKTFTLPPYKKKVYVNQEDLAAYYYQCRRKAIVEGDDKTLIRIDKELRAMKLPLDPN